MDVSPRQNPAYRPSLSLGVTRSTMTSRKQLLWSLLLAAYATAIFLLSSLPLGGGTPFLAFPGRDSLLHATEFGVFFLLARKAFGQGWVALLVTALYAGSDELHQILVPTRDASLVDVAFDLVGACTAAAITAVTRRIALSGDEGTRILRFWTFRSRRGK